MPRTLKRRSEVIDEDVSSSSPPPPPPESATRRRRRSSTPSSAASINVDPETQTGVPSQLSTQVLVKKLVRLALSAEYARLPLRRNDISQIFKDNNAPHKLFKPVFAEAQKTLQHAFGMTLVEMPSREKTTLKDRRAQATQTQKSQSAAASNKVWMLVSTLPEVYKQDPIICPPTKASSQETEAGYTALYTFVLSLIYLNNSALTDAKLERYLKRVNADTWTPIGATDKLLQRMLKEGYIEKRRDLSGGEEIVEWVVGPRGKVEIGVRGVANLVKGVYGLGTKRLDANEDSADVMDAGEPDPVKFDEEELEKRLERSLGVKIREVNTADARELPHVELEAAQNGHARRKPGRRRRRDDDDDSDDG